VETDKVVNYSNNNVNVKVKVTFKVISRSSYKSQVYST